MNENATFYAFKPSGKWKYSGRGHFPEVALREFPDAERISNVRIITNTENQHEAFIGKKRGPMSAATKAKISSTKRNGSHASLQT